MFLVILGYYEVLNTSVDLYFTQYDYLLKYYHNLHKETLTIKNT